MVSLIKKLDYYSINKSIKIEGKNSYNTFIGGLMTIVFSITYLCGIFYFGSELWLKQKPTVVVFAADFTDPFPIPVNDDNFNIYFCVVLRLLWNPFH